MIVYHKNITYSEIVSNTTLNFKMQHNEAIQFSPIENMTGTVQK